MGVLRVSLAIVQHASALLKVSLVILQQFSKCRWLEFSSAQSVSGYSSAVHTSRDRWLLVTIASLKVSLAIVQQTLE